MMLTRELEDLLVSITKQDFEHYNEELENYERELERYEDICWWCYWGWNKPIREVYDKALTALGGNDCPLRYGPAHVVWEDENWDSAELCLEKFDEWKLKWNDDRFSDSDLEIVRQSLIELIAVPDEFKEEPAEYDGEHPEKFPPPSSWEMIRR
jgi:hypothetical protein